MFRHASCECRRVQEGTTTTVWIGDYLIDITVVRKLVHRCFLDVNIIGFCQIYYQRTDGYRLVPNYHFRPTACQFSYPVVHVPDTQRLVLLHLFTP